MKKLLVSTLCYGPEYSGLFVGPYLTALLDPSNLPSVKDRVAFELYTDQPSLDVIRQSMQFMRLQQMVPVTVYLLPSVTYETRYQHQGDILSPSLQHANTLDAALMVFNADQCMAKGLLPRIFEKLDAGYGAIAAMPMRCTAEHVRPYLEQRAYEPSELFELAFPAIHPIWIANHWDSACFSNVPYQLCWSDPQQLVLRMTAINLLAVVPTPAMLSATGCADMVLWQTAENVYWAFDWMEFPVVAVEPLHCFWPAWTVGQKASPAHWLEFAAKAGITEWVANLSHAWIYRANPNTATPALIDQSRTVVDAITRLSAGAQASAA